jgi:hypothetical protein
MIPLGYVMLTQTGRGEKTTRSHQRWLTRVPGVYAEEVLGRTGGAAGDIATDRRCLAQIQHYRSLMPMAQEVRRPIFQLRHVDGAIGIHQQTVRTAWNDFSALAMRLARGMSAPDADVAGLLDETYGLVRQAAGPVAARALPPATGRAAGAVPGPAQPGQGQFGAEHAGFGPAQPDHLGQPRPAQPRPAQPRPAQPRPAQLRPAQPRAAQAGPAQAGPAQPRLSAQAGGPVEAAAPAGSTTASAARASGASGASAAAAAEPASGSGDPTDAAGPPQPAGPTRISAAPDDADRDRSTSAGGPSRPRSGQSRGRDRSRVIEYPVRPNRNPWQGRPASEGWPASAAIRF